MNNIQKRITKLVERELGGENKETRFLITKLLQYSYSYRNTSSPKKTADAFEKEIDKVYNMRGQ